MCQAAGLGWVISWHISQNHEWFYFLTSCVPPIIRQCLCCLPPCRPLIPDILLFSIGRGDEQKSRSRGWACSRGGESSLIEWKVCVVTLAGQCRAPGPFLLRLSPQSLWPTHTSLIPYWHGAEWRLYKSYLRHMVKRRVHASASPACSTLHEEDRSHPL